MSSSEKTKTTRRLKTPLMTELAKLLNTYCQEDGSDTPDYILAGYLIECLKAFDRATKQRDKWHGFRKTWAWETTAPPPGRNFETVKRS